MAKKYLDETGLAHFWDKLKAYFQPKLVSGTNIKTINNTSILGSGNISVPTALSDLSNDMVVSDFTNDAGYLAQHQDISGKVDKSTGDITLNTSATSGDDHDLTAALTALGWLSSVTY